MASRPEEKNEIVVKPLVHGTTYRDLRHVFFINEDNKETVAKVLISSRHQYEEPQLVIMDNILKAFARSPISKQQQMAHGLKTKAIEAILKRFTLLEDMQRIFNLDAPSEKKSYFYSYRHPDKKDISAWLVFSEKEFDHETKTHQDIDLYITGLNEKHHFDAISDEEVRRLKFMNQGEYFSNFKQLVTPFIEPLPISDICPVIAGKNTLYAVVPNGLAIITFDEATKDYKIECRVSVGHLGLSYFLARNIPEDVEDRDTLLALVRLYEGGRGGAAV